MIGDPERDLVEMWQALRADGVDDGLARDVARLVQHNVGRARFEAAVLDDIDSIPTFSAQMEVH